MSSGLRHARKVRDQLVAAEKEAAKCIEEAQAARDASPDYWDSWNRSVDLDLAARAAESKLDALKAELLAACRKALDEPCVSYVSATAAYLSDGTKIVLRREGQRVWMEQVPQEILTVA